jgi:hypothetical protein
MLVENLPSATARTAPDGHRLLLGSAGPLALNRWLYRTMPFDSRIAFMPVVLIVTVPNVVMTHPDLGAASLAAARQRSAAA